jgi:hypothetical protein
MEQSFQTEFIPLTTEQIRDIEARNKLLKIITDFIEKAAPEFEAANKDFPSLLVYKAFMLGVAASSNAMSALINNIGTEFKELDAVITTLIRETEAEGASNETN